MFYNEPMSPSISIVTCVYLVEKTEIITKYWKASKTLKLRN